eukprot:SAG11_NODE_19684_length_461_cov_0.986188_1_plen_65_part_01
MPMPCSLCARAFLSERLPKTFHRLCNQAVRQFVTHVAGDDELGGGAAEEATGINKLINLWEGGGF